MLQIHHSKPINIELYNVINTVAKKPPIKNILIILDMNVNGKEQYQRVLP